MLNFLKWFSVFIVFYHVLTALVHFSLFPEWPLLGTAIIRDVLRWFFIVSCVLIYRHQIRSCIKQHRKLFWWVGILIVRSIISSLVWHDTSRSLIILWIKYNFQFLIIFFSALFIGHIRAINKRQIKILQQRRFTLLIRALIIWLLRQWLKHLIPWLFSYIGYGPVGDFHAGIAPPLYYRTWPWWFPRLSWLFSWPNNYGYLLVAFFSRFIRKTLSFKKKNNTTRSQHIVLYMISWLLTLSRWRIIWIITQWLLVIRTLYKKNKQLVIWWALAALILFGWLTIRKRWSTTQHLIQKFSWITYLIEQPRWRGLGSSWPAVHHVDNAILPENFYMQIGIDTGRVWLLIRCFIIVMIVWRTYQCKNNTELVVLTTWFIWLLVEGLFLHVFEDSMVNYLFFIYYGIIFWHTITSDKILYHKK